MTADAKEFSKQIAAKIYKKISDTGNYSLAHLISDSLEQMIANKIEKEGWTNNNFSTKNSTIQKP